MITQKEIAQLLSGYDKENITIGVLGSHSALDICRGAKDEGFKTLVVCQKGREKTYAHYYRTHGDVGIVDEVLVLDRFKDLLSESVQETLRKKQVIFIPHRSFQVYLDFDYDQIEQKFLVPLFGNRFLLRAEERNQPNNQYDLLKKASIRMPHIFESHEQIDRLSLVKIGEKKRVFERSFFYCSSPQEYKEQLARKIKNAEIDSAKTDEAVIEECIIGTMVNFNYFYSPLHKRLELLGTDTRRQTNLDGLLRLTADKQLKLPDHIQPKLEESGHCAVTILESMLEKVLTIGDRFVDTARSEYKPGIIGPFALQSAIIPGPPEKDIVVFDVSLRVQGSPGTKFTPYTEYLHGRSLGTGRRIAIEIKQAIKENRLHEVVT